MTRRKNGVEVEAEGGVDQVLEVGVVVTVTSRPGVGNVVIVTGPGAKTTTRTKNVAIVSPDAPRVRLHSSVVVLGVLTESQ